VLARTVTHALVGLDPRRVEVEAHLQLARPSFAIVGLADRACQEAKERVRSGITSAELVFPVRRITVNLAPAGLRKEGSGFDLPIALAVLAASHQLPPDALDGVASFGELALDGRVRPVPGALIAACWAAMVACGEEGYLDATKRILETATEIKRGISELADVFAPSARTFAWAPVMTSNLLTP
jgi:magnesium chelatase family protein